MDITIEDLLSEIAFAAQGITVVLNDAEDHGLEKKEYIPCSYGACGS